MNWLLPEYLADALPAEAARIETMRRRLLDTFRCHGYELVIPPLVEYLDSLLTGAGQDLSLRTFKLVDQLSGRTLGLRADTTPQVARIDAHLLNREGVVRLCYCDSVLHARPANMTATREPLQIGAELYGHAGLAADLEIIRLAATCLKLAGLGASRVDLGHVGIFRALASAAGLDDDGEQQLLDLLKAKDVPGLQGACSGFAGPLRAAFLALPTLYGGREVLARAREVLPPLPGIGEALGALEQLAEQAGELPLSFDLADLRGYHYHNGVVFAIYCPRLPTALVLGGRYDGAGAAFGRARPATGFSLDLRELVRLAPAIAETGGILAPAVGEAAAEAGSALREAIGRLRDQGEVVVELLPGEARIAGPKVDRQLVRRGDAWVVETI